MSIVDTGEIKVCVCGRTLWERNGVTMCPSEDTVQPQEQSPERVRTLLDDTPIDNPFGDSARQKSVFDRAHDAHYSKNIKAWYPEQAK